MAVVSAIAVAVGCATMCSRKASKNLAEGDPAPDFTLQDSAGTPVTLSSFRGKKCVVLYFYPKDGTPGCTAQACSFRDSYEEFTDLGAEVIGVSSDSAQSHSGFAAKHSLPFILLSDEGGRVRKLYGVPSTAGVLPGRVTFVIDKQGIIRHTFSSQFKSTKHVEEALRVIREIVEE